MASAVSSFTIGFSDQTLRQEITACTNVVEGYHYFLDWIFFGKQGVITEHDPEEQEKRLKYLDLVASAVILQNAVDISYAIRALSEEGYPLKRDLLVTLSPYLTRHLKRYGDYVVDPGNIPQPLEGAITLPIDIAKNHSEQTLQRFVALNYTYPDYTPLVLYGEPAWA